QPLPLLQASNLSLNSGATVSTAVIAGPTAQVNDVGLNSTLDVTAGSAGTANSFTFSDAGANYLTQTGISNVTTNAQDAVYSVNGATYQSTTGNTATVDSGHVTLSFGETTSSAASVTVSADTSSLAGTVTSLV